MSDLEGVAARLAAYLEPLAEDGDTTEVGLEQHWTVEYPLTLGDLRHLLALVQCTGANHCQALQHIDGCFAHPCISGVTCTAPQHIPECEAVTKPLLPPGSVEIDRDAYGELMETGVDRIRVEHLRGSIFDTIDSTFRHFYVPGGAS